MQVANALRRLAALVLMCAGCAGCADSHSTAQPSTALTVRSLQYRDDVVANRLQLQVTNGLEETLRVTSIRLDWDGFESAPAERTVTLTPGRTVDLPVPIGRPACSIDGTHVADLSARDATAVLTLDDGSTRVVIVDDVDGLLTGIHHATCVEEMVALHARVLFTDLQADAPDGHAAVVGQLRVERGTSTGDVVVHAVAGTIPFSLVAPQAPAEGPLVVLPQGERSAATPVWFVHGRCDAHAVAETKQPFRFVATIELDDGSMHTIVVEPDESVREMMLSTVADRCRSLGLDGALDSAAGGPGEGAQVETDDVGVGQ